MLWSLLWLNCNIIINRVGQTADFLFSLGVLIYLAATPREQ